MMFSVNDLSQNARVTNKPVLATNIFKLSKFVLNGIPNISIVYVIRHVYNLTVFQCLEQFYHFSFVCFANYEEGP